MKKEDLIKLGLDEVTATKVADASAEELKGFIPKVRFDEVNEAKKDLEGQVKERDKQLDDLKKSTGDVEALKTEIATLQETNKTSKAEYEGKIKQIQIDSIITSALTTAKAKNLKAVRALLNFEKVELDGETIKGLDDQIKTLQTDESSKFLFDAVQQSRFKGMKPGESPEKTYPTDKKPNEMTYSETLAYLEANPDAKI